MFIIYGTKKLKKELGTYSQNSQCQHCNNVINYSFFSVWTWFTLFWIPIFPVSRKKYYSVCPICSFGYEHTKEEIEKMINQPNAVVEAIKQAEERAAEVNVITEEEN